MGVSGELICWRCGTRLADVIFPVSRREECSACGAELHVCRQCAFYDSRVSSGCTEEMAEEVRDKEKANFCDYYKPGQTYRPESHSAVQASKARLAELFGDAAPETDQSKGGDDFLSTASSARQKLDELFEPAKNEEADKK